MKNAVEEPGALGDKVGEEDSTWSGALRHLLHVVGISDEADVVEQVQLLVGAPLVLIRRPVHLQN
jgi:hypothetical protein